MRWARPIVFGVAVAGGLAIIPFVLPILPVPRFLAYQARVKRVIHTDELRTEHMRYRELPQDWADMHGWPELAAAVERVYRALPADERARAAIVASNYGEAAAIDFFAHDLPPALSGHNQYFLWGPRGATGDVVIDVHGDCGASERLFASSTRAATVSAPLAMPSEDGIDVMVCRGIRTPLAALWPRLKWYY